MNTVTIILVFVGIPVILFIGIILWIKSNNRAMLEKGKELIENYEENFENAEPANATVIDVINSKAMSDLRGKIKMELNLEISKPGTESFPAAASWIVDAAAISNMEKGRSIPVRVDEVDNNIIYPDVEWASYWMYD